MRNQTFARLRTRFQSFDDLARQVSDGLLRTNIPIPKNKTIAEHLWCIVGARESFSKALREGAWAGFSCSVEDQGRQSFIDALTSSADLFERIIGEIEDWTPAREELLLDLLEHEAMHEGQLIRHMYALGESLPSSWKWA